MLEVEAQVGRAVEVAAHVRADANVGFGRRSQVKMRVEAGDAVDLIERGARALRKSFELGLRQKAVAQLDGPQVVEDHSAPSRVKMRWTVWNAAEQRRVRYSKSSAYYWCYKLV